MSSKSEYIPFGNEWLKAIGKMSIPALENSFGIENPGLSKTKFIELIRANLIVKQFNETYKIGDTLKWKSIASLNSSERSVKVKSEAWLQHGCPVVFFYEINGFCSIEPKHFFL